MDHIDGALLRQADRIVGWCRDQDGPDQWLIAIACVDSSLALLFTSFIVDAVIHGGTTVGSSLTYLFVFLVFGYSWSRERESIRRLSATPMGAFRARVGETINRQASILVLVIFAAAALPDLGFNETLFLGAVAVFDAALYFKAAEPPPPIIRRDRKVAVSSA